MLKQGQQVRESHDKCRWSQSSVCAWRALVPWQSRAVQGFGEFLPVTPARTPLPQLMEKTLAQVALCFWLKV